jgi:hypothetical protein
MSREGLMADLEKAEAELAAARPLLDAALSEEEPLGPGVVFQAPSIRGRSIIERANAYRAALACRESDAVKP